MRSHLILAIAAIAFCARGCGKAAPRVAPKAIPHVIPKVSSVVVPKAVPPVATKAGLPGMVLKEAGQEGIGYGLRSLNGDDKKSR